MKKLMSLMFLAAAAFAGGGLMNEQNLTTFVNYLYHKQQVGTIVSLGTITDSPPAELPATLPATPGAVPANPAPAANSEARQPGNGRNADGAPSTGANVAASPIATPATAPGSNPNARGTGTIPGTAPEPISIQWPDRSKSTFVAGPKTQASPNASLADAPAATPPSQHFDSPPPALANDPRVVSNAPHVPPPQLDTTPPQLPTPARDDRSMRAAFDGQPPDNPSAPAATPSGSSPSPEWIQIENRMRTLGVVRYEVSGSPDGKKKFRCEIAIAGAPKFEADHDNLIEAANKALKRVVLFHGARKASTADGYAEEQPESIPASKLPRMIEPGSPGLPSPSSPPGPLTPPSDLPN